MPHRILVVEDDPRVAEMLVMLLDGLGYSGAAMALTGAEGVRLASEQRPNLVILDLTLPDMAGADVLDAIKKASPGTKVLVTTGDPVRADGMRERGAVGFLMKPFKVETLEQAIKEALTLA